MTEHCYKKIAKNLGVPEYKVLAVLFKNLYKDKNTPRTMFEQNKISKKTYNYIMSQNIKYKKGTAIFTDPTDDFPNEIGHEYLYTEDDILMKWKINGSFGRKDNLPARVLFSPDVGGKYTIQENFFKEGKLIKNDKIPSSIIYDYDKDRVVKTTKIYHQKTGKRTEEDSDETFIESWQNNDYQYFRTKDLPSFILTFKKTGKQMFMWNTLKPGVVFRENDKPSIIKEDGTQIWTLENIIDRDSYAIYLDRDYLDPEYNSIGQTFNFLNSIYIGRKGKPAVIKPDGTQIWYTNGLRQSIDDKPALIKPDGTQEWYDKGLLHRDNNPAIIYPNGKEEWWIHGKKREERDLLQRKLKNTDVVDKIMRMM